MTDKTQNWALEERIKKVCNKKKKKIIKRLKNLRLLSHWHAFRQILSNKCVR